MMYIVWRALCNLGACPICCILYGEHCVTWEHVLYVVHYMASIVYLGIMSLCCILYGEHCVTEEQVTCSFWLCIVVLC